MKFKVVYLILAILISSIAAKADWSDDMVKQNQDTFKNIQADMTAQKEKEAQEKRLREMDQQLRELQEASKK